MPRAVRAPQAAAVVPHGVAHPVPAGQAQHARVPVPAEGRRRAGPLRAAREPYQ